MKHKDTESQEKEEKPEGKCFSQKQFRITSLLLEKEGRKTWMEKQSRKKKGKSG